MPSGTPKQDDTWYELTGGMHFAAEHTSSSAPDNHWGRLHLHRYLPQDGWVVWKRAEAPETYWFLLFTQVPQVYRCARKPWKSRTCKSGQRPHEARIKKGFVTPPWHANRENRICRPLHCRPLVRRPCSVLLGWRPRSPPPVRNHG